MPDLLGTGGDDILLIEYDGDRFDFDRPWRERVAVLDGRTGAEAWSVGNL